MVDKKFVLKVSIDGKNKKKLMPVFNVLRLSNDPDIIKSVCATATPVKVIFKHISPMHRNMFMILLHNYVTH